jgi:hypothetical protein
MAELMESEVKHSRTDPDPDRPAGNLNRYHKRVDSPSYYNNLLLGYLQRSSRRTLQMHECEPLTIVPTRMHINAVTYIETQKTTIEPVHQNCRLHVPRASHVQEEIQGYSKLLSRF